MEKAKNVLKSLLMILSVGVHAVYYTVLNTKIYVDQVHMPDGETIKYFSPIERLSKAGESDILTWLILLSVISIITSVLVLFGVNRKIIRTVQIISTIASLIVFIVMMIASSKIRPRY